MLIWCDHKTCLMWVFFLNSRTNILLVNIVECRNLATADRRRKRSDPYVKCYLLPERKNKQKTDVKKKTVCPVYNKCLKVRTTFVEFVHNISLQMFSVLLVLRKPQRIKYKSTGVVRVACRNIYTQYVSRSDPTTTGYMGLGWDEWALVSSQTKSLYTTACFGIHSYRYYLT